MRTTRGVSLLAFAALAACLLSGAGGAVPQPSPGAQPADTPQSSGGIGPYQNFVANILETTADEPLPAERPVAEPGKGRVVNWAAARRWQGIQRQAELLDKAPRAAGWAALVSGLLLWAAERNIEQAQKPLIGENQSRVMAWRAQLPPGSEGEDVVMLADAKTGKLFACFTKEFWLKNRAEIRKAYPDDMYEFYKFTDGGGQGINNSFLPPLNEAERELARKVNKKNGIPLVDSFDDLKVYTEPVLSDPDGPNEEPSPAPGGGTRQLTNPYPTPDPADAPDAEYTPGMMERDLRWMKGFSRALVEYEERRRGASAASIGGVALAGETRFGEGSEPEALFASRGRLFARAGGRDLFVEGVDLAEFSVFLRGAALGGRAPLLSIGTEPSGRAGYQKVSYVGGVRNTSVGEAMLKADVKLKGLLLGIGVGEGGSGVGPVQEFLWTFPRVEGLNRVRLWLAGGEAKFERAGARIVAGRTRVTLRYESAVRDRPEADPEMERFVAEFNRRWPEIAEAVPEFRRLERLAATAALARWAADSGCLISPELWVKPFDGGRTPEYVPAYIGAGGSGLIVYSGGVSLLGDESARPRLGLALPFTAANLYSPGGGMGLGAKGSVVLALAFVLGVLLPAAALGLVARAAFAPSKGGALFARSLKAWALALALLYVACAAVAELSDAGALGAFDSDFSFALTLLALPAALLRLALGRGAGGRMGAGRAWVGLTALGLWASLSVAALSAGFALILVSGEGVSAARLRAANVAAAPFEAAARPFVSLDGASVVGFPSSVTRAARHRFSLPAAEYRFDPGQLPHGVLMPSILGLAGEWDTTFMLVPDETLGPVGAPLKLRVVSSRGLASKRVLMSVTGEPPY